MPANAGTVFQSHQQACCWSVGKSFQFQPLVMGRHELLELSKSSCMIKTAWEGCCNFSDIEPHWQARIARTSLITVQRCKRGEMLCGMHCLQCVTGLCTEQALRESLCRLSGIHEMGLLICLQALHERLRQHVTWKLSQRVSTLMQFGAVDRE